jgi:hypothetical protein
MKPCEYMNIGQENCPEFDRAIDKPDICFHWREDLECCDSWKETDEPSTDKET